MPKHAFLSASASHRWLNCPPSAKLCEGIPDQSSPYAQEGTDCHELCAYLVEKAMGKAVQDPTENLTYYNVEMQNCAEEYCSYVMEQLEAAKQYCLDPMVFIEQRLDFSRWVENGFGTGDCLILADQVLQIIDYKHGLGVLVEAEKNSQMMCYALGALEAFDGIYDIDRVTMTIFQPRRDNISTWSCSKKDLLAWANEVLAPTAALAYEGKGEFKAGDHCQFCKAKAPCRKRAEFNLEMARYDFEMPATLDETEIAAILPRIDQLISWGNDLKDYFQIHKICKSCEHMKHVSTSKLIKFKILYCIQFLIHALKIRRQDNTYCFHILIPDLAHYLKQHLLIGVPVYLLVVENPCGCKNINECGNDLYFLVNYTFSIAHAYR